MTDELKITLVQTTLEWENPEANRKKFQKIIQSLEESTDLIILPEMFTTGFTMNAEAYAETMEGKTVKWIIAMAREKNAAITGSIIVIENGKFFNRLLFVTPEGKLHAYDKKHLFTLASEQETYTAGNEKLIIQYKGWKICPMICYDLRFPVWVRNTENYDVLIYVANWPKARIKAWDVLLQARAIENMAYCIGVNRVGIDGKEFEYVGHSTIYDGLGEDLFQLKNESEAIMNTILYKNHILEIRKKLQFLEDKDDFDLL
jgi:predicted amidohydrolase